MNDVLDPAPPAVPRPVRWDEAVIAGYLHELGSGSDDAD
jgi:hypothetical protein